MITNIAIITTSPFRFPLSTGLDCPPQRHRVVRIDHFKGREVVLIIACREFSGYLMVIYMVYMDGYGVYGDLYDVYGVYGD